MNTSVHTYIQKGMHLRWYLYIVIECAQDNCITYTDCVDILAVQVNKNKTVRLTANFEWGLLSRMP